MYRPIKIKARQKKTGKIVYAEVCRDKNNILLYSATTNVSDIEFNAMRLCTYIQDDHENFIYDEDILDVYDEHYESVGKFVASYDAVNGVYRLRPFPVSTVAPDFCDMPLGKALYDISKKGWRVFVANESL